MEQKIACPLSLFVPFYFFQILVIVDVQKNEAKCQKDRQKRNDWELVKVSGSHYPTQASRFCPVLIIIENRIEN